MAIPFVQIEKEFDRLRSFLKADLHLILQPGMGGNYVSATLITCACDALGWLQYGQKNGGAKFFSEKLLPQEWKAVGKTIYYAVRNGLVHSYETKDIMLNGREIVVVISRKDKPHLTFSTDKKYLYLNVRQLAQDLERALCDYENQLKGNEETRATFLKYMTKGRELFVKNPKEAPIWESLLNKFATTKI